MTDGHAWPPHRNSAQRSRARAPAVPAARGRAGPAGGRKFERLRIAFKIFKDRPASVFPKLLPSLAGPGPTVPATELPRLLSNGRRQGRCGADDCGAFAPTSRARHGGWSTGCMGRDSNDRRDFEESRRNDNRHSVHASQVRCNRLRQHVCGWPERLPSINLKGSANPPVAAVRPPDFPAR
jgi:hypothetical protein